MWLIDPRPNHSLIVDLVEKSFELSEASSTPVLFELRVRGCHQTGTFAARDNKRTPLTVWEAAEAPRRDVTRIRSEEHTSELPSLMRISSAVFCLKTKNK